MPVLRCVKDFADTTAKAAAGLLDFAQFDLANGEAGVFRVCTCAGARLPAARELIHTRRLEG